jgi:hypothetical protein
VLKGLVAAMILFAAVGQPAAAASSGDGERLLAPNGVPLFISGMNYEGPADRAWQMWEDGKFDPAAIDADFTRAAQGGVNTIRLFVQPALAADLAASKFDKLDGVIQLAEKHGLQLIVSLHDYTERDLAKVSATAGQLAQRFRGRPGILAFDLKNEPRFGDIALTRYGAPPPLQQRVLIDAYGERLPRAQLADYRAGDEGSKTIPSYLTDDEAWIYVNDLRLYREMLAEASVWVKDHGGTTVDFLGDAASQKWAPVMNALNGTLEAWLTPQVQAIRSNDPLRAITVDHVDVVLARLPANDLLDFQSLHRYPGATGASVRANLNLLAVIERAHPGKPFVLSEFGYATETVDPDKAALAETAVMLGLAAQHAAGGAKWMLNDMPQGFNMRERTLGAYYLDGSPKPIVGAMAALRDYLTESGSGPGDFRLEDDKDVGLHYVYSASDALFLGGKSVQTGAASMEAGGPAQLFLSWTEPALVQIWASGPLKTSIDLGQVFGGQVPANVTLARLNAGTEETQAVERQAVGVVSLNLQRGGYVLHAGSPPQQDPDYDVADGHFFTQTNGRKDSPSGFSVTNEGGVPLWTAFRNLGGADVLGYPVTRRFEMDGFVVQGFQKSVLQWRPDQKGFAFLNTFDVLHDRGRDAWLQVYRQTPPPVDNAADTGLSFERVTARHVALLDNVPAALKTQFLADPDWLDHYGLPVAIQDVSNSVVVRAQRASLQYWKEAVPWAAQGSVTLANGGDLAKEAGVFPWLAVTPENAPR